MRVLNCLRCNAEMAFLKREKIQLGQTGLFFGDWPNIIAGSLDAEIYCCSRCGKLEFFLPTNEESDSTEAFEEGEFLPLEDNGNIVGVSAEGVPQVKCPRCGRIHDFDYPKCIYCDFDYHA